MQPAYTQQAYRQYPSTPSRTSDSGFPSHPRVFDSMTSGFTQRVAPSYNAQPYTTQDVYNNQLAVPTGPAYGNDAYGLRVGGGTMSVHDLNHATASWGTSASQTLYDTNYSMPSIPNSSLGQGIINDAGCHFDQVLGPTSMNFSPHISGANANRGASSEWRFHNCWVSHEEQDEIHLTIALKRT